MRIQKAVIPTAGFATRLLPATRTVPKQMMPVLDRPAIHYTVEEAVQAGDPPDSPSHISWPGVDRGVLR